MKIVYEFPMEKLFFELWEEFEAYHVAYMNSTFTRVLIDNTGNCVLRNKNIVKQVRVKNGTAKADRIPSSGGACTRAPTPGLADTAAVEIDG